MDKQTAKYISTLKEYKTPEDYAKALRKHNQALDHVIVSGTVFTIDHYDSEGKSLYYGNLAESKTMEVETENRYGPTKFKDAKVSIYDMMSSNNSVRYLMKKGGTTPTAWKRFVNWLNEEI